ncbi:hypothetical protein G7Y89_g7809 [Cudoniella acicularis]|uniref:Phosphatidylinositol-specific phospholipase C X domain-containing protein n=1 Tax=Cudoniella acicularis TaxID=354080 RepID=A0A8H4W3G1_9HELO|nr:hypothetical protein G7Y89_g7809 [Cudoniella acicularis]
MSSPASQPTFNSSLISSPVVNSWDSRRELRKKAALPPLSADEILELAEGDRWFIYDSLFSRPHMIYILDEKKKGILSPIIQLHPKLAEEICTKWFDSKRGYFLSNQHGPIHDRVTAICYIAGKSWLWKRPLFTPMFQHFDMQQDNLSRSLLSPGKFPIHPVAQARKDFSKDAKWVQEGGTAEDNKLGQLQIQQHRVEEVRGRAQKIIRYLEIERSEYQEMIDGDPHSRISKLRSVIAWSLTVTQLELMVETRSFFQDFFVPLSKWLTPGPQPDISQQEDQAAEEAYEKKAREEIAIEARAIEEKAIEGMTIEEMAIEEKVIEEIAIEEEEIMSECSSGEGAKAFFTFTDRSAVDLEETTSTIAKEFYSQDHTSHQPPQIRFSKLKMAWIARGPEDSGLVQSAPNGKTQSVPALTTHRGELWCLWSDPSGYLYYAVGDNNVFQSRRQFPDRGIPVMAELTGVLHAIIIRDSGDRRPPCGFWAHTTPALVAFHNKLFLVFIQSDNLYYSILAFHPRGKDDAVWSPPQEVSGISQVGGIPALFVLNGVLHVLCSSKDESREILGFAYSVPEDIWNSCDDVSEGKSAAGVSATSFGDSAFLAFQENGPDDTSHLIYISEYKDGKWQPQEAVAGQASSDPPQLSVLNGRINCIFNSNDDEKNLIWYSRPLLEFSLSSWMKDIPDQAPLSALTIPGTHDTCAESNIPFVRTQYLSVTKQLEAGLRFLDLRCRADKKGVLYMYHGGIPINMPTYLKFDTVMNEVFTFFEKDTSQPTETVLVSINNDDTSGKEPPSVFYNAVKDTIERTPHYSDGSPRWITSRTTSKLGDARGKAVLIRRYHPDPAVDPSELIGMDLSGWLDNNPDFTLQTADNLTLTLQDHWKYAEVIPLADLISSKFKFVSDMLRKAAQGDPEHWFINFTSAVGDPAEKGEIAESHWIAVGAHSKFIGKFVPGMNENLRRNFEWGIKTRYGVVPMDYPELPKDSDLIAWLIGTNM